MDCLRVFWPTAAFADSTEILYQHKAWVVEGVTFDDGTYACLAEVSDPGESFTIWTFPDRTIRLQFYSDEWDFGESDTANLEVEIDRRSPWTLTGANLTQNSVLFDLPDLDASVNFVVEVAKGPTLVPAHRKMARTSAAIRWPGRRRRSSFWSIAATRLPATATRSNRG